MKAISLLKHNKFQQVDIPKPSALFSRVGAVPGSRYSGETYLRDGTKIETAQEVMREADKMAEEAEKAATNSTDPKEE